MAITSLTHHDSHPVRIHMTRDHATHYAALRCVQCNKHIQWLNQIDYTQLVDMGIEVNGKVVNR